MYLIVRNLISFLILTANVAWKCLSFLDTYENTQTPVLTYCKTHILCSCYRKTKNAMQASKKLLVMSSEYALTEVIYNKISENFNVKRDHVLKPITSK